MTKLDKLLRAEREAKDRKKAVAEIRKVTPPRAALPVGRDTVGDAAAWRAWMTHLHEIGRDDIVSAAELSGKITVCMRWPKSGCPLPITPRPKNLAPRIIGENDDE